MMQLATIAGIKTLDMGMMGTILITAISLTTNDGIEILIHIGIDTVNQKSEGFTAHVILHYRPRDDVYGYRLCACAHPCRQIRDTRVG